MQAQHDGRRKHGTPRSMGYAKSPLPTVGCAPPHAVLAALHIVVVRPPGHSAAVPVMRRTVTVREQLQPAAVWAQLQTAVLHAAPRVCTPPHTAVVHAHGSGTHAAAQCGGTLRRFVRSAAVREPPSAAADVHFKPSPPPPPSPARPPPQNKSVAVGCVWAQSQRDGGWDGGRCHWEAPGRACPEDPSKKRP